MINWRPLVGFLSVLVALFSVLASPAFAENPFAEENLALFEEALRIQGLIRPEVGAKDVDGSEAFAERNTRMPDVLAGDWILYTPFGEGYYWSSEGRVATVNNYRAEAELGLPLGNLGAEFWNHAHFSAQDSATGYRLVETDHLWYSVHLDGFAGTGLSGSYTKHDVNRGVFSPSLPEYDTDTFGLSYRSGERLGFEWRADYTYSLFESDPLGFDSVSSSRMGLRGDYRISEQFSFRLDLSRSKQGAADDSAEDATRYDAGVRVRYGESSSPWFAGADAQFFSYYGTPVLNTHLEDGFSLGGFAGWRGRGVLKRLTVGFERDKTEIVRLRLEEPELAEILSIGKVSREDLEIFYADESPATNRWYVESSWRIGKASLTGEYSSLSVDDTATGTYPDGSPLHPLLPDEQTRARASLDLPIFAKLDLTVSDWYRRSESSDRDSTMRENILTADLNFAVTGSHNLILGAERAEWELGGGVLGLAGLGDTLTEESWTAGWTGDVGGLGFRLIYTTTSSDGDGPASGVGDWNTFETEFKFKAGRFPVTLGARFFDGDFDDMPRFNYEGTRYWLSTTYEF